MTALTQSQAKALARRIPFNPFGSLPPDVHNGLERVVQKQVRRVSITQAMREQLRWALRAQNGMD